MTKKLAPATNLTDPIFSDEALARAHFEALRWEGGVPVCFHCGVVGDAVALKRDEKRAEATLKSPDRRAQRSRNPAPCY